MTEKPAPKKLGQQKPKKSPLKTLALWLLGALAFVWLAVGIAALVQTVDTPSSTDGGTSVRLTPEVDGNATPTAEEDAIDAVIAKASPAVVSIITEVNVESFYFGTSLQEGAGSGVIVSSDGYILTNKHVIDDARNVSVVLEDGTAFDDVDVVATDPLNDVAYLKLNGASDLPVAELGDSTTIRVGQRVIAIGNSLGLYQNTVTSGIISGTGRPVAAQKGDSVESLTDLIQTDAAINPGNSGGPLLNASGQVIGLNTAIAQNAEGIGFAIPINATKGILKQVLAGEDNPQRAYLGVRYIPVNVAVAEQYDLSVTRGALINAENGQRAVVPNSPADDAGLQSGDVITKVGDVEVGPRGGVASLVAEYAPGDTVPFTIVRGDRTFDVDITLTAF